MTTITVVSKDGAAAIAADQQSGCGGCKVLGPNKSRASKIVSMSNGHVGVVGSTAHQRVLESLSRNRMEDFEFVSIDAIFETFRKLHRVLVEEYYLRTDEDDDDQPYDSSQLQVLIAAPSGIYEVQGYREIIQYERFWSAGSGRNFALGAMEALYGLPEWSAADLAKKGVEVACQFDTYSGLPLDCHVIELDESDPGSTV